jgi:hypothetical protein
MEDVRRESGAKGGSLRRNRIAARAKTGFQALNRCVTPVSRRFSAVSGKTSMKISNFGIPKSNFDLPKSNFDLPNSNLEIPNSKLDEGSRKLQKGRFGRRKGSFARYFPARKTFPHINEQLRRQPRKTRKHAKGREDYN